MTSTSPRTRCRVQRGNHPALRYGVQKSASCGYCLCRYFWIPHQAPGHPAQRCGVQKSASCGYCLCRYFWIPHQVRNDREGISGYRRAPGHPAQRCGVQCVSHPALRCRVQKSASCGYCLCQYSWIPHQVRNDREGISGYRVAAQYDVEHRSMTRKHEMTGTAVFNR